MIFSGQFLIYPDFCFFTILRYLLSSLSFLASFDDRYATLNYLSQTGIFAPLPFFKALYFFVKVLLSFSSTTRFPSIFKTYDSSLWSPFTF